MKNLKPYIIASLALTLLFALLDFIFGLKVSPESYLWGLLVNVFISIVIGTLIRNSTWSGFRLALSIFIVYFVIGHFSILIEAYVFDVTSRTRTLQEMTRGFLVALAFAPICTALFKPKAAARRLHFKNRNWFQWLWRILAGDLLYLFMYSMAGFILVTVYPQILDFYENKIPPLETVVKTQLFLRGFLFAGVAILISRTTDLSLLHRSLMIGLVFSIIGGIAPLLTPNELMPTYVRYGHLVEVGTSNLLVGIIMGFLLGQKIKSGDYTDKNQS